MGLAFTSSALVVYTPDNELKGDLDFNTRSASASKRTAKQANAIAER